MGLGLFSLCSGLSCPAGFNAKRLVILEDGLMVPLESLGLEKISHLPHRGDVTEVLYERRYLRAPSGDDTPLDIARHWVGWGVIRRPILGSRW